MKYLLPLCLFAVTANANIFDTIGNGIVDAANTVGHGVVDAANTVGHVAVDTANTVSHGVVDAANTVGHGVVDAANTVGHGVVDAANTVGGALNSLGPTLGLCNFSTFQYLQRLLVNQETNVIELGIHGPNNSAKMCIYSLYDMMR